MTEQVIADKKTMIQCPQCQAQKIIEIPGYVFSKKRVGIFKIRIHGGSVCEHEFVVFVDQTGIARGYEKIDIPGESIEMRVVKGGGVVVYRPGTMIIETTKDSFDEALAYSLAEWPDCEVRVVVSKDIQAPPRGVPPALPPLRLVIVKEPPQNSKDPEELDRLSGFTQPAEPLSTSSQARLPTIGIPCNLSMGIPSL